MSYRFYEAMADPRQAGNIVVYPPDEYTKMLKQQEKRDKKQEIEALKLQVEKAELEQRLRNAQK